MIAFLERFEADRERRVAGRAYVGERAACACATARVGASGSARRACARLFRLFRVRELAGWGDPTSEPRRCTRQAVKKGGVGLAYIKRRKPRMDHIARDARK